MWIDSRLGYQLQALKGCNVDEAVHHPPLEAQPISVVVGLAMKQSHMICDLLVRVTLEVLPWTTLAEVWVAKGLRHSDTLVPVVGRLGVCIMKTGKS